MDFVVNHKTRMSCWLVFIVRVYRRCQHGATKTGIRELAGMSRYMGDDVQTTLAKRRPWSPLPSRYGTDYGYACRVSA